MNVRAKTLTVLSFALATILPVFAAGPVPETAIIGGIHIGESTPVAPARPRKQPAFKVKNSTTHRHSDGRRVTVQEVEQPESDKVVRKEKTRTPAASTEIPPAQKPVLRDTPAARPLMRHIGVSATIYGRGEQKRTRLTINSVHGTWHGWSNIDFRHLSGIWGYRANGREYFLTLGHGIARADNGKPRTLDEAYRDGCPRTRRLAGNKAAFILTGKTENHTPQAHEYLRDLHTLYRKERPALTAAFHKREQNNKHRANNPPPPPKDSVTISFWKRDLSGNGTGKEARK